MTVSFSFCLIAVKRGRKRGAEPPRYGDTPPGVGKRGGVFCLRVPDPLQKNRLASVALSIGVRQVWRVSLLNFCGWGFLFFFFLSFFEL